MPEPPKPGEKPKPPKKIPSLPVSQMPEWTQSYGSFTPGQGGAKAYTLPALRGVDRTPRGQRARCRTRRATGRPYSLMQMWNPFRRTSRPSWRSDADPAVEDEDGFKAWVAAQPTPQRRGSGNRPITRTSTGNPSNSMNNKSTVESLLDSETDPHKKQALLDLYQKYYGAENKPTLAEGAEGHRPLHRLGQVPQDHPPETVAKLLKKKIKDETDPTSSSGTATCGQVLHRPAGEQGTQFGSR